MGGLHVSQGSGDTCILSLQTPLLGKLYLLKALKWNLDLYPLRQP